MKPARLAFVTLAAVALGAILVPILTRQSALAAGRQRVKPASLSDRGVLQFQGRGFFPIGIYHVNHTASEYALLAAHGFNTIQGSYASGAEFLRTLDLAQTHRLAVSVPVYANNRVNLDATLAKIRTFADHPAVLSWKVFDEPDSDRRAPFRAEVIAACRALIALRPARPIELTLTKSPTLVAWAPLADALQIDRYPLPGKPLTQVAEASRDLGAATQPWQHTATVIQCGYTPDLTTQPTVEEARSMVFLALIHGAKGIHWYSRQDPGWDLTTSPLWPHLRTINAEIAALAPAVIDGTRISGLSAKPARVRTAAWKLGSQTLLIATNPTREPVTASLTLPTTARVHSPIRRSDSQPLPWTGRQVTVDLPGPGSVAIVFQNRAVP